MKKISIVFFMIVLSNAILAQGESLTLDDAISLAKKNNRNLLNAKAEIDIAYGKVKETASIGLPQLSGSVDFVGQPVIPTSVVPNFINPNDPPLEFKMGISNSLNAKLSLTQLIFDGTYFLGLKAAKEYVKLAEKNMSATQTETIINVSQAYFMVLLIEENQKLTDANLSLVEKTFQQTKGLFENGFAEKLDIQRLNLQLSNLKTLRNKLQDQHEYALRILKLQMGLDLNKNVALSDKLNDVLAKTTLNNTDYTGSAKQRPEFQALEQLQVLNHMDKKRYRLGYLPSLAGFLTHQQQSFATEGEIANLGNRFYPGTLVGLSLQVPIFDGFYKRSKVEQAQKQIYKTNNQLLDLNAAIQNEQFTAKMRFARAKEELENQKANLEIAKDINRIATAKYNEGVGSSLELIAAGNELKTAETNYLAAVYELLSANLELNKANGSIK
jgi:outer membrane protein TolC